MLASIHLTYVLGTLPFEQRFAAARKLGFQAVEFPFPYSVPARDYAQLLADHGLSQISIGAPAADYKAGMPAYSLTPTLKPQFDQSISTVIDYAKVIGCSRVHVFAGSRAPDVSEELAFETYCQNLAEAHDRLEAEGLGLVVEPVNSSDFSGYFLDRLDLALRAIARAERPGIKIILDVYHAHVNGEDPVTFLRDHGKSVAHIQLADYPGRHEPGTGKVDFDLVFQTLRDVKYGGSVGLEYVPTRSIFDGVPLAAELGLSVASGAS
ncbi:hydroxypyruvate isomerase [Paraburkholderia sp. MM5496-R1]|uniref:hydroxypyruvate isomerase family protein n=1 Tax=Paraburkholderia sp. MM5496-R1 TaxID=2991065 RepID=UPI003D1B290F